LFLKENSKLYCHITQNLSGYIRDIVVTQILDLIEI
jgi:hypothetical protein